MRFLADESCDAAVIRALREAGHDVSAVGEVSPRAEDSMVIDLALREGRILITEDKDFGQLVYASGFPTSGVVLLRYPFMVRETIVQALLELVGQKGEELFNRFIVVQPGRIRISPAPT